MIEKRRITVVVTSEEHEAFTEAAFASRESLSEWVRRAARSRAADAQVGMAVMGRVAGPAMVGEAAAAVERAAEQREVKPRRPKEGMCEHRVPAGTFCKKCGV